MTAVVRHRDRFVGRIVGGLRRPSLPLKVTILLASVVAYATAGFMFFELESKPELQWLDALWWAMVTMSTVGFGDYFPVSTGGRLLVGIPAMLVGMGMLGYALSRVAALFIRAEALNRKGLAMQKLREHILICNYPSAARVLRIVSELRASPLSASAPVVIVDEHLAELDDELARMDVRFVRGHPGREATLARASLADAAQAIVLARDPAQSASDDVTVATCLSLRHLRPELHIVAECVDPANEELLRRAGAKSTVCVANLAPGILVRELTAPGVIRVLEQITLWGSDVSNVFIVPLKIEASRRCTVADVRRWAETRDATLLGVRLASAIELNPPAERELTDADSVILLGRRALDSVDL